MAGRPISENTRNKQYRIRLNETEEKLLNERSNKLGLKKSECIRFLITSDIQYYLDNKYPSNSFDGNDNNFYINEVIKALDNLKENCPECKIYIEIPGNVAECKLGDALIYDTPDRRIAIDAE